MKPRSNPPRYPQVRVAVSSANPLAAISAIRGALRQAGVGRREIARFSQQAFDCRDLRSLRQLCSEWVDVDAPGWRTSGSDSDSWPALSA